MDTIELLALYKGAKIYEMNPVSKSEGQKVGYKVKAQGMLPEPQNVKVDFFEEAGSRQHAVNTLKGKIDRYLDQQEIEEFVFEHPNQ